MRLLALPTCTIALALSHTLCSQKNLGIRPTRKESYGAGFPTFTAKSHSLLKKHLTVDIYEQLKDRVGDNRPMSRVCPLRESLRSSCNRPIYYWSFFRFLFFFLF